MNQHPSTPLQIKTEKEILFVRLNRPEKRNALNPQMIRNLLSVFKKKKWDPFTRGIVLSGEGKAFCSGADLKWMADESLFTLEELENLFSLFEAIALCPLPVIALVQGFAVGGGLGLLSVSDVVIAEESAQFRFSETRLGLVPSVISPFVLKKIGLSQAKFLMLSALPFSAQQAKEVGLVHFTGSKEKCDQFLEALLQNFKELDSSAVSKTKEWLNSLSLLTFSGSGVSGSGVSGSGVSGSGVSGLGVSGSGVSGSGVSGSGVSGSKHLLGKEAQLSDNRLLGAECQSLEPSKKRSLKTESARIISSFRKSESTRKRIKNLLNRRR